MTDQLPERPPADPRAAAQVANEDDFRDHLGTADKSGHRRWLYPRQAKGQWYRWRTWLSWLLLGIMFAGPFIRINGNPLLLVNIIERRFSILGRIFWPQDALIFAVAMLVFFTGIIVFTTAFGRLWCGWTCPQTLLMEMVFRKIEIAIEGDDRQRRALDNGPWSARKIGLKLVKHGIFFGLSFLIGNTLLSYLIGSEQLLQIITDPPAMHLKGLVFMVLFTLLFYAIFARFREQACTFICPYGRFQSAMLDENTLVVAYDHKRGEPRGPLRRHAPAPVAPVAATGDCVACNQCVAVCPTGIDIRHGTQMECVNCTACIDACDAVMDKVARPRGLIRFASLNNIERREPQRFTARMKLYSTLLAGLISFFLFLLFTRGEVSATLLRAPGALYTLSAEGRVANLYTLKLVNKTTRNLRVRVKLEGIDGQAVLMGGQELLVPRERLAQTSVLVEIRPELLLSPATRIRVVIYSGDRRLDTIKTVFAGPRGGPVNQ